MHSAERFVRGQQRPHQASAASPLVLPLVASHNFGSELVRDLMAWRVAMRSATLGR